MKTYVDLSWIRGRAKAVLLFEIKHVANINGFSLKCENLILFEKADFIYFDTENTIISDLDSLMSKTLIVPASNKER